MSAGFTPGPWYIDRKAATYADPSLAVMLPNGNIVAEVLAVDCADEVEADASLIAAAPELYEALEQFVNKGSSVAAMKRAMAALAKARVES